MPKVAIFHKYCRVLCFDRLLQQRARRLSIVQDASHHRLNIDR